jgi:hypothetical protein
MDIVIHYQLAFEEDALALARRLFAHFDEAIDALALVPIADDEFDLVVDGRLLHSLRASGRPPRLADALAPTATPSPA